MRQKTPVPRGPGGKWLPGQSANPGGRPVVLAELRELCRQHTGDAIKTLVELMTSSPNDNVRRAAAVDLLNRGYGMPTQPITTESERELSKLTDAELAARASEVARALMEAVR